MTLYLKQNDGYASETEEDAVSPESRLAWNRIFHQREGRCKNKHAFRSGKCRCCIKGTSDGWMAPVTAILEAKLLFIDWIRHYNRSLIK